MAGAADKHPLPEEPWRERLLLVMAVVTMSCGGWVLARTAVQKRDQPQPFWTRGRFQEVAATLSGIREAGLFTDWTGAMRKHLFFGLQYELAPVMVRYACADERARRSLEHRGALVCVMQHPRSLEGRIHKLLAWGKKKGMLLELTKLNAQLAVLRRRREP